MDLTLALHRQQAEVCLVGGRLSSYRVAGRELLAGQEDPARFAYRGALLVPWPNRVAAGRWSWQGEDLELPVNDPDTDSALHGLVSTALFAVESQTAAGIVLVHELGPSAGYPFRLLVRVTYGLEPGGLVCSLTAVNLDDRPAPVGLGVHPYVTAPGLVDDLELTLPARTQVLSDAAWFEVGRVPAHDFRTGRRIGPARLDTAFTDLVADATGRLEVVFGLEDGLELVLWSGATCRWLVVYTGDTLLPAARRRSVTVEPQTCPPNALVTGQIDVLEPGAALRLDWGFTLRPGKAG